MKLYSKDAKHSCFWKDLYYFAERNCFLFVSISRNSSLSVYYSINNEN